MTAQGALDAYRLTGDDRYLDVAINSYEGIVERSESTDPSTYRIRGPDILFLAELSEVTGNNTYAEFAQTRWEDAKAEFGGGNATGFAQYIRDVRIGLPAVISWDINLYIQGVLALGHDTEADEMAEVIYDSMFVEPVDFNSTDTEQDEYWLAFTGAIDAFESTDMHETEIDGLVAKLVAGQDSDGKFIGVGSGSDHQTTAYAIIALLKAGGEDAAVSDAAAYLIDSQGGSGEWLNDGDIENSEITSEGTQAIFDFILPEVALGSFTTIQDAINAATAGDTINIAAGTYVISTTLNIDEPGIQLMGTGQNETIIDASSITNTRAILWTADDVSVSDLTLIGPSGSSAAYGFKIQPPESQPTPFTTPITGVTLTSVTVVGSGGSEFDLHFVDMADLTNVIADGNGTAGVGIAMTDSQNVTIAGAETMDNNWGGVGIFAGGCCVEPGGSSGITVIDLVAGEANPLYTEEENNANVTGLDAPQFMHTVKNSEHRTQGDSEQFTYYQESVENAIAFAQAIQEAPFESNNVSVIQEIGSGIFIVAPEMSVQVAIDKTEPTGVIHIYPGEYVESGECPSPMCSTPNSGLFINKNGITLQGVDEEGNVIEDANEVETWIIAGEKGEFGFLNPVVADDVTIQGLGFTRGANTGSFKTVDVMGDNLVFVNNVVNNSGVAGSSALYFSVNPNVRHPNINEETASGFVNDFQVDDNIFIAGTVTVAGGVGIEHTFEEGAEVDGFPTYTIVWDPESDLVPSAVRTITNNVFMSETGETQETGISLVGYIPDFWGPGIPTIPTGPVAITDNTFNAGIDDPISISGGQNAANPDTPIIDLAEAFDPDTNTFTNSVLVTVDADRTEIRAGGTAFPIFAIQSSIANGVDIAEAEDFVWVGAGEYDELVTINKSISLLGANDGIDPNTSTRGEESTITGSGAIRLIGSASGVTVDGFEFTATSGVVGYEHGIILLPAGEDGSNTVAPFNHFQNISIQNNWFHDLSGRPVFKDCFASFDGFIISNNRIVNVTEEGGGDRTGIKIQSRCEPGTPSTDLNITDNVINGTTYAGIIADGVVGATISDNTIANVPEHGINFGASEDGSGNVTISGNQISNAALPDGKAALRIKGGTYSGAVRVLDNTFTDSRIGLLVESGANVTEGIEVSGNAFSGNLETGLSNELSTTVDARNNYWGSATGPFHATDNPSGTGDSISDNVLFEPYYIDAGFTTLSSESQVVADEEVEVDEDNSEVVIPEDLDETIITVPSTVTDAKINVAPLVTSSNDIKEATLPKLNVNANTTVGQVQIAIPNGTKVTADKSWDGNINVPTIKPTSSVTVTPSDEDVEVDEVLTVIEIGFDDVALEFDTGVRILIPDMAGNLVGYSRAGTFTPITDICAADTQAAGNALPDSGDCKIDAGDDLAVWTKHFTSFVVYNEAPATSDDDDGGSGGGGGGGGRDPVVVTWPTEHVTTFPASYFEENPLAKILIGGSAFLNAGGVSINQAGVGQQLDISGTFTNYQDASQDYAFIVQVIDENGVVTDIAWQTGMLESGATADVSTPWTPEAGGTYTVKIFVWDGISATPEVLSQVTLKKIAITE